MASENDVQAPTFFVPSEYFESKGPTSTKGTWLYSCKKCINKTISTSVKSRYNLRQHIKSKHTHALKKYDEACISNDNRKAVPSTSSDKTSTASTEIQPTVIQGFKGLTTPFRFNQKQLDSWIVNYIVDSVLPFNHVDSEAFKSLIGHMAPKLIVKSRKTYQNQAKSLFDSIKQVLVTEFTNAKYVCLTADHWSSHRKGYMGVTAHWCGHGDGEQRKQACLALRRILGRVTFDVIAETLQSIMEEFGLMGKVTHCITDSGSNFVKAFAEFGNTNLVNEIPQCVIQEADLDDTFDIDGSTDDDILVSTPLFESLTPPCDSATATESTGFSLPKHFRCAAHRLNLVASSDCQSALDSPVCKRIYRSLTAKLQAIWNKQNRSVLASEKIHATLGGLFVIPNTTRWNSFYDGMLRVHNYYQGDEASINSLFQSLDVRPITTDESVFLEEFIRVMKPVADGLDILQGEKTATAGHLVPTLLCILDEWKNIGDLKYTTPLVNKMSTSIHRRFEKELSSDEFTIAAALHPAFKLNWIPADKDPDDVRSLVRSTLDQYTSNNEEQCIQEDVIAKQQGECLTFE